VRQCLRPDFNDYAFGALNLLLKIALSRVKRRAAISDEDPIRVLVAETDSLVPAVAPTARTKTPATVPRISRYFRIEEK
jgi:hypothetical protein